MVKYGICLHNFYPIIGLALPYSNQYQCYVNIQGLKTFFNKSRSKKKTKLFGIGTHTLNPSNGKKQNFSVT